MSVSVSIIVPCYNVAAYLDQCMESLAGQSMEDIEIICVNDGSSDHTAEILREWRDRDGRVRVIDRKNSGVSAARNSGMEAAAGKYIGFVDPDDVVERNMFRRLFDAAVEKDADVAVCGYHEFCDRGGMDMPESGWSPSAGFFPEEKAERFRRGTPWSRCAGTVWNKLIRRKLLEENGVRFVPGLRQGEDLYFCLMLLTVAPRLLILPDRLYHYRRERPGSASCGRDPRLGDFRMELMRRHFIMKEGAFFKASPEDREVLLSGWKKWLELVGAENVLPSLDRWDRAFCRLLLDCPLRSNFFSALHSRLMSSRKGRRGAYYTLKRHLMK
jgi:glycosyltransferase involved in cell wall biosynthesis